MATIIDSIKTYLSTYQSISNKEMNVNYLGMTPQCFSIENVPTTPIIKRYSDGETIRQYCFLLASRENYDSNNTENTKIAQFYEEFERWIEKNNSDGTLPNLSDLGLTAEKIEVLESGYIYNTAKTSARFQIKLRLLYRQKY